MASAADCGGAGKGENAGRTCALCTEKSGEGGQALQLPQVPHDDSET